MSPADRGRGGRGGRPTPSRPEDRPNNGNILDIRRLKRVAEDGPPVVGVLPVSGVRGRGGKRKGRGRGGSMIDTGPPTVGATGAKQFRRKGDLTLASAVSASSYYANPNSNAAGPSTQATASNATARPHGLPPRPRSLSRSPPRVAQSVTAPTGARHTRYLSPPPHRTAPRSYPSRTPSPPPYPYPAPSPPRRERERSPPRRERERSQPSRDRYDDRRRLPDEDRLGPSYSRQASTDTNFERYVYLCDFGLIRQPLLSVASRRGVFAVTGC